MLISSFLTCTRTDRFAFHEVLAARTYQTAGKDAENYAVRCYSVAMLEYEAGQWGNIKVRPRSTSHGHYILKFALTVGCFISTGPLEPQLGPANDHVAAAG